MKVLDKPLEIVKGKDGGEVLRFCEEENYSDPFGYEWEHYSTTYTDSTLGENLSESRLELNLGFPLEFLKGMNVLEIGCGQGRFTEHLVKHAKHVVAVDMSYAIYHNIALPAKNITAVRADLHKLPKFEEKFDLVFCRGVLQHTSNPRASMKKLFDYAKDEKYVIFDIYKSGRGRWTNFKFFWRPILQKTVSIEKFDGFINRHENFLYNQHHRNLKIVKFFRPVEYVLERTPLLYNKNFNDDYSNLDKNQRIEIAKNEMIDMFYAGYDQPMSPEEVVETLAEIGQRPYSYDIYRNHFRCRKNADMKPIKVKMTKNGVLDDK